VVLNEKLLEAMGDDVTQEQAFAHANDVLKNAVGGISDTIHIPGLVNVDFEDVNGGRAGRQRHGRDRDSGVPAQAGGLSSSGRRRRKGTLRRPFSSCWSR